MFARDVFVETLEDPDLVIQVHAQRPTNLDCALQVAQHMEAVMRTVTSRSSKAVRAVAQYTIGSNGGTIYNRFARSSSAQGAEGWAGVPA